MITATIILILLVLLCVMIYIKGIEEDYSVIFGTAFAFAAFLTFLFSINISLGSKELTGYIYSSNNRIGYTTAHIRFSQNAGSDAQPEFCVKTDSEAARAIQQYVGADTKVRVSIPAYFYFSNNPFACGTTDTVIERVTK
jgi:Pyruvate/2-oxoacid:ferredoxin oxidoreductase gamma subunit